MWVSEQTDPCPVCNHETESFYGGERGEAGPFRRCLSDDCGWNEEEAEGITLHPLASKP